MTDATVRWPGANDFLRSLRNIRIVTFISLSDLRARYKRSVLGPLWLTLSTAAGSAGLGFIWSQLMHVDAHTLVPAMTAGLILWQLISQPILEATTVFSRQASMIRNLNLPISIHPIQLMFRHLINLAHNAPVFFIIALALGVEPSWNMLLAIPALFLVSLNLFWIVLVVSILGARYRDLEYLIASVMPLLMFVSPVFYRPHYLTFSPRVMWFNPFSHLIELVRYPLLGALPPWYVVLVNLVMLAVGGSLAFWLFNSKRERIPFWL